MTPIEQESLLLRQIAALRRRGWSQDRALEGTRRGLRSGELLDRVNAAQRALAEGWTDDGTADLLARGDAPIETLELGAAALEARASAASALALMRLYLSIAAAGPLVLASLLAWLVEPFLVLGLLKFVGIPLAVGAVVLVRWVTGRIAPGVARIERGARLLDAAARGEQPEGLIRDPVEQTYFVTRRSAVGSGRAMEELATELVREGEAFVRVFRHLAPVVGGSLALGVLSPLSVLLVWGWERWMWSFIS